MRETGRPATPRARSRRRRRRPWRWPNRKSTDAGAATNVPCLPSNGWGSCAVLSARSPRHLPAAGRRGPQETMGSREETPEMGFKDAARRLLGGVLFVATAVMAGPALARAVLALDEARQPVPLLDAGDAWIDATGAARVEDVAGNAGLRWEPTHDDAIYRISTAQPERGPLVSRNPLPVGRPGDPVPAGRRRPLGRASRGRRHHRGGRLAGAASLPAAATGRL